MNRTATKALVLPFERQDIPTPANDASWLYLNAMRLPNSAFPIAQLVCEQSFKPHFLDLQSLGYKTEPHISATGFEGALVLVDRAKLRNQYLIAKAIDAVSVNALVIVAGEKDYGIASLKKWASSLSEPVDSFSKFHSQVFILRATEETKSKFTKIDVSSNAGLFGGGKIDKGSQLLASTFDSAISGNVADFGSGTGYLSNCILEQAAPATLDLYEAEQRALTLSKEMLTRSNCTLEFHWCDLTRESISQRFDWVVMNPPFHQGRAAEPQIGQDMIKTACKALRPGGRLRLVANRQLPYEGIIHNLFGHCYELTVNAGFKVLEGRQKR